MSEKNTGGPAFPVSTSCSNGEYGHQDGNTTWQFPGISIRDYFAAKAMASVWADIPEDASREQALIHLGECAYEMADAMLRAREGA